MSQLGICLCHRAESESVTCWNCRINKQFSWVVEVWFYTQCRSLFGCLDAMPQQALTGSRKQLTRLVTSKMPRQPADGGLSGSPRDHCRPSRRRGWLSVFHRNSGPPPSNVKPYHPQVLSCCWFGRSWAPRTVPSIMCHSEYISEGLSQRCHQNQSGFGHEHAHAPLRQHSRRPLWQSYAR